MTSPQPHPPPYPADDENDRAPAAARVEPARRCIWLSEGEAMASGLTWLYEKHAAAPADPVEAGRKAIDALNIRTVDAAVRAVLGALGWEATA